ncbi:MAG: hypothetical protein RL722_1449 [Pseudomonadota bacterium]|jgi:uroporphyrinogen-III synthase
MSRAALILMVTRPEPQAGDWVRRLQARGQAALALPLLGIEALAEGAALAGKAWLGLAGRRLVMFVSPNAVAQFVAARPAGLAWPGAIEGAGGRDETGPAVDAGEASGPGPLSEATLAGATGPGTVAALRAAGVPEACILAPQAGSASFDAEALWRDRLSGMDWAGRSVLIVRGEGGRDWLATTLRSAGAAVDLLPIYRQTAPAWLQTMPGQPGVAPPAVPPVELMAALAEPAHHVWLFSSSQAVRHLDDHLAATGQAGARRGLRAIATHPRIAQTVIEAGWGEVRTASAPLDSVLAALHDLAP